MKQYKVIIFDLDGTLLDTLEDLTLSTNFALKEMGYPEHSVSEIRKFVGNGIAKLIERAVPVNTPSEKIAETLAIFKKYYAEHCEDHTAPYAGVVELLDKLLSNGKKLSVVSNKIDSAVSILCKQYFGDRFAVSIGDREGIRKKPSPDSVLEVLQTLGVSKEDAVYIGDSDVDIETAKNAEMDCISVTWGFRDSDVLLQAWGLKEPPTHNMATVVCDADKRNITAYFADTASDVERILLGT